MERVADGLRYLQHREGRDAVSDQCAEHAPALEFGEQGQVACTERHHHECQRPVWKMERVADGLRYLQHREGRDAVSDQCAEHAPALEFGEQGQEHQASVSIRGTRSLPLQTGLRGGTLCLPTSADSAARRCEGGTAPTLAWPRRTCDRRVRGKRRAKADLERGQRAALLRYPRSSGEIAGAIR